MIGEVIGVNVIMHVVCSLDWTNSLWDTHIHADDSGALLE